MSQENTEFSFELNESLYFEQGQEVGEILGISLDPEISIQPFNEYISIRGVIELNGSYQKVDEAGVGEDNFYNMDNYTSRRYVEKVTEGERGETSFTHRFPVEISVPTYRVSDLNDVTVSVDYFDYEIPDQNQLRLTSIIAIQGINDITEPRINNENNEEIEPHEDIASFDTENTFSFDVKEQFEEEETREEFDYENNFEPENVNYREPQTNEWENTSEEEAYTNNAERVKENQRNAPTSSVKSTENKEEEANKGEKIDYLSNMFRQSEENYSRMRLCIVQDNDTIETIAERYQVNPIHISKQNNLEDETISEGQLLYIPLKQSN